jgi:hypothetical protein
LRVKIRVGVLQLEQLTPVFWCPPAWKLGTWQSGDTPDHETGTVILNDSEEDENGQPTVSTGELLSHHTNILLSLWFLLL